MRLGSVEPSGRDTWTHQVVMTWHRGKNAALHGTPVRRHFCHGRPDNGAPIVSYFLVEILFAYALGYIPDDKY